MENLGYYNGIFGLIEEMVIPMNDRVHFFGDGVYDATFSANHVVYLIEEHIDRFFNSAEQIKITIPHTKAEVKAILEEMAAMVEAEESFVYWQVTRGTAPRNHAFPDTKANFWITVTPFELRNIKERMALTAMEDTRHLHCNIKTLNLLPSVMASQKASEEGCQETVFYRGDIVTECAHSNVSILKDGMLKTHPNDRYILPGIAKSHLIMACKALKIPVDETAFTMSEMEAADEIIVTSSSNFCSAVKTLKGRPVGGKAPKLIEVIQDYLVAEFRVYCGLE